MSSIYERIEINHATALLRAHGSAAAPPPAPAFGAGPLVTRTRALYVALFAAIVVIEIVVGTKALLLPTAIASLLLGRSVLVTMGVLPGTRVGVPSLVISALLTAAFAYGALTGELRALGVLSLLVALRITFRLRHRIVAWTDALAMQSEERRIRSGGEPRIFGLIDEVHGGDPSALPLEGPMLAEVARLYAARADIRDR